MPISTQEVSCKLLLFTLNFTLQRHCNTYRCESKQCQGWSVSGSYSHIFSHIFIRQTLKMILFHKIRPYGGNYTRLGSSLLLTLQTSWPSLQCSVTGYFQQGTLGWITLAKQPPPSSIQILQADICLLWVYSVFKKKIPPCLISFISWKFFKTKYFLRSA
jgi:hypothetical protein